MCISEEEGEADSFVGQGPEPTNNPFQNVSSGTDPFANVGHNPFPPSQVPSSLPQRFNTPQSRSSPGPTVGMGQPGHIQGPGNHGQMIRPGIPPPSGNSLSNIL